MGFCRRNDSQITALAINASSQLQIPASQGSSPVLVQLQLTGPDRILHWHVPEGRWPVPFHHFTFDGLLTISALWEPHAIMKICFAESMVWIPMVMAR